MLIDKNANSNFANTKVLCHAIVQQAAEDYLKARKNLYLEGLMKEPNERRIKDLKYEIRSIKRFFKSDWYTILCKINSDYWIPALDEEFERRKANNFEDENT